MPHNVSLYAQLIFLSLAILAKSQANTGVVAYWDADRPSSGWRDSAWQKGGSGRMHFDQKIKRHGIASLRLDGLPAKEIFVSSATAHVRVKPEGDYIMRFWTRRSGNDGQAKYQILAHRMADEQRSKPIGWIRFDGKDHRRILPSNKWVLHEIPLGALPGGTERLYFYFRVTGETTLWIDEFSLAEKGVEVNLGGKAALTDADYAGIRFEDGKLPENLLKNGGFEEGMNHWQLMNQKVSCNVEESQAKSGKASLHLRGAEFAAGGVFQRVQIDPRRRYRLSFRAKGIKLVGYFFTKILRFDRQNHPRGWIGGEILYCAQDEPWAEKQWEFTPTPSTDNVVVYLRLEDTIGDVWVDDVRLEPLPLAKPGDEQ